MLDFVKCYLCINSDDVGFFFFHCVNDELYQLIFNSEPDLCSWNEPHLIIMYHAFHVCLDLIF